jgi:hypothetical protein
VARSVDFHVECFTCVGMNTGIFDNLTRMKYEINRRYADSLQLQSAGGRIRSDVIVTPQVSLLKGTAVCCLLFFVADILAE